MTWSCCVYLWVIYLLRHSIHDDNRKGIMIVSGCVILACLGLFAFPFCTEITVQVLESWDCCCYKLPCCECCCQRSRIISNMTNYADKYGWREALINSDSDQDEPMLELATKKQFSIN